MPNSLRDRCTTQWPSFWDGSRKQRMLYLSLEWRVEWFHIWHPNNRLWIRRARPHTIYVVYNTIILQASLYFWYFLWWPARIFVYQRYKRGIHAYRYVIAYAILKPIFANIHVNSLPVTPCGVMWLWSLLIQVRACQGFGSKALSEPTLT